MKPTYIGSFESKTKGEIRVFCGADERTRQELYNHSYDPKIEVAVGAKDRAKRVGTTVFPRWLEKGGGRLLYTGWSPRGLNNHLAGALWLGGEPFPAEHYKDSPIQPGYTIAWRTAYEDINGGTFESQGIGKYMALMGIAHAAKQRAEGRTYAGKDGADVYLPPLRETGLWLETDEANVRAQGLYHHLGNSDRGQEPIGFVDVGTYQPPYKEGASQMDLESRVGMIAGPETVERFIAAGAVLLAAA